MGPHAAPTSHWLFIDLLNPPYNTLPCTFPCMQLQQQNRRFCKSSQSRSGATAPYMELPESRGAHWERAEGRVVCVWPTLPHSQKKVKSAPNGFVRHELYLISASLRAYLWPRRRREQTRRRSNPCTAMYLGVQIWDYFKLHDRTHVIAGTLIVRFKW